MDPPQVQLPGSESAGPSQDATVTPDANHSVEVEMGGAGAAPNDEDHSLLDAPGEIDVGLEAHPEPEPPAPPKKNAGLMFLEYAPLPRA
ncbi:hypothetical protein N7468_005726 [Penicillium chermesinum]|uniref:Uncharacterized protein n=1 Tax=Penicillium chermesinum TaxID=63820 RepID=A0A9W9P0D5_9EURO|nr:uncharacterized protein N7468_005726 [Penicillium chermesinum]KAJ5232770.1 hypothetical protein N7468_005726 [Penicillium chermesinum]KAJ6172429.1 hypothetical protein N7470_001496 [Penicillium chermesinum]